MAIAVIMPKQGQSVETCIITKWFKNKGEKVSSGDILFSYETDKAAFDLESPADGILLDTFYGEGAEVPVLVNVAVIGQAGEATDSFNPEGASEALQTAPAEAAAAPEPKKTSSITNPKVRISPRAKRIAEDKGIEYNNLKGTGPNGRIVAADILLAFSSTPVTSAKPDTQASPVTLIEAPVKAAPAETAYTAGTDFTEQPLTNVRKIIAKAMFNSLQNSAQLTHHMSADVRHMLEARQKIKANLANDKNQQDITLNDMVCWCVIRALEKFPEMNSHFLDDRTRTFRKVNLGLAVDTSRGLMVPALKNASDFNLPALSRELKSIADACRKGSIDPSLIQSTAASFTVSNLGNYGVEMFTPVINLPQAGILGVCTIISRPVDFGNHTYGFVPYIGLSLTYDHRAIDGGPATLFLKEVKEQIENFSY